MTDVVSTDNESTIVLTETDVQVVSVDGEVLVVSVGEQGPPGPPGQSGAVTASYIAATAVGGHRMVLITTGGVTYASNDTLAHLGRVIGMTTAAANVGDPVPVQAIGELTEPSWNWDTGKPVYLGMNGLLTQAQPVAGAALFSQIVGFPVSTTTLYVTLREPVLLA